MSKPIKTSLSCRLGNEKCPLLDLNVKTRGIPTFSYGKNPSLYIIADSPDEDADRRGEPMIGPQGNILWALLKKHGLTQCYISYTLRCHLPKGREPDIKEMGFCSRHIMAEIKHLQPKVILFIGRTSANFFLKFKNKSISSLRGWHSLPIGHGKSIKVYVTNNPAALQYDPDLQSAIEDDLCSVKRFIDGQEDIVRLKYKTVYLDSIPKLKEAVDRTLQKNKIIFLDYEGRNLNKVETIPVSIAWGWLRKNKSPFCYVTVLEHPETPWNSEQYVEVKNQFRRLFTQRTDTTQIKAWVAHNAKHEWLQTMDWLGGSIQEPNFRITNAPVYCSMQLAHACDENRRKGIGKGAYSLEGLAKSWAGISSKAWDDRVSDFFYSEGEDGLNKADKLTANEVTDHPARDIVATMAVYQEEVSLAKREGFNLNRLQPLLTAIPYLLAAIERNGMPVSVERLAFLKADKGPIRGGKNDILLELESLPSVQKTIKNVGCPIPKLFSKNSGGCFHIRKREYLLNLFFNVLELPPLKYGKKKTPIWPEGEPSVNSDFFDYYQNQEECKLIKEWRILDKLETGFVDSWWEFVSKSSDHRIRPNFNGVGTTTGRISCSAPNLMQIPSGKNKAAKKVKSIFMPHSTNYQLNLIVAADYSQAEVRWLAQISGDPVLTRLFVRRKELLIKYAKNPTKSLKEEIEFKTDLHRATAAEMFGIPIDQVTSLNRSAAKKITFGLIYGETEFGLAHALGISVDEAISLRETWLGRFKRVNEWFKETERQASREGWVESPLGRRRRLPTLLLAKNTKGAEHAKRVSRNAPVQEAASSMNIWLAYEAQKYIDKFKEPWKLLGLVHDSILAESPIEKALNYINIIQTKAESSDLLKEFGIKIKVPMEVEFEIGYSYGECIKLTPAQVEREQVMDELNKRWKKEGIHAIIQN